MATTAPTQTINEQTLKNLKPAWKINTPGPVSHEALLHNGRLYFGEWNGSIYCVKPEDGSIIWHKKLESPDEHKMIRGFTGTGVVVDGVLVEGSFEGTMYGLNPETGDVLWTTDVSGGEKGGPMAEMTSYQGVAYVGICGLGEVPGYNPAGFHGAVVAVDAKTGKIVWRTSLVHPPHDGVGVWSALAIDHETNILYASTGDNYSGEASDLSDALVAMDAKTGEIKWHRQAYENDVWTMDNQVGLDYDFSGGPQLFEATIDSQQRKLVGAASKSGFFFVFDRTNGDLVWKTGISYGGVLGGLQDEVTIHDGTIYSWGNNSLTMNADPRNYPVNVAALDAATGRQKWVKVKVHPAALTAGAVAGDVYLTTSLDGCVRAYRLQDGKEVWTSFPPQGPISSALTVSGDSLYFGTGVPPPFGGSWSASSMVCFRLSSS